MANRQLDRVLTPEYLHGLDAWAIDEIRSRRAECQRLEDAASYLRRLVQTRIDIIGLELRSRANGEEADLVSLIAAAILYWRAIGSVQQFAFLLGLSTILDLLVSYFFMHPVVQQLAKSRALVATKRVGIAAGLDTPEATV